MSSAASAAVVSSAALVAAAAIVSVFSVSAALLFALFPHPEITDAPLLPLRADLHVSSSCSPPGCVNIELFCSRPILICNRPGNCTADG